MEIRILDYIEGARQAVGLTVIIDVFRAFSLECYAYAQGIQRIYPVGDIEEAYARKRENPQAVLVGERKGRICEGFDFGNSPAQIADADLAGRVMIHTTSAGTQGIVNAVHADEIITGSLVNARAVASYIKQKNPTQVSLVAMGTVGTYEAKEDTVCAEYIRSLLLGEEFEIKEKTMALREDGGDHFFLSDMQDVFPEGDFWMSIQYDRFPFVLRIIEDEAGRKMTEKVDVVYEEIE